MGSVVRVAAVQAAPVAFDLAQSIEKVQKFALEAATAGADLVVFP
jgi:predicted amidohydrolase